MLHLLIISVICPDCRAVTALCHDCCCFCSCPRRCKYHLGCHRFSDLKFIMPGVVVNCTYCNHCNCNRYDDWSILEYQQLALYILVESHGSACCSCDRTKFQLARTASHSWQALRQRFRRQAPRCSCVPLQCVGALSSLASAISCLSLTSGHCV